MWVKCVFSLSHKDGGRVTLHVFCVSLCALACIHCAVSMALTGLLFADCLLVLLPLWFHHTPFCNVVSNAVLSVLHLEHFRSRAQCLLDFLDLQRLRLFHHFSMIFVFLFWVCRILYVVLGSDFLSDASAPGGTTSFAWNSCDQLALAQPEHSADVSHGITGLAVFTSVSRPNSNANSEVNYRKYIWYSIPWFSCDGGSSFWWTSM